MFGSSVTLCSFLLDAGSAPAGTRRRGLCPQEGRQPGASGKPGVRHGRGGSPGRKRLDGEGLWADVWLVGRAPASGLHQPSPQIQARDHMGWLLSHRVDPGHSRDLSLLRTPPCRAWLMECWLQVTRCPTLLHMVSQEGLASDQHVDHLSPAEVDTAPASLPQGQPVTQDPPP